MKPPKWRNTTPTKKQIRQAFDAQAPFDGSVKPLDTKRKTLRLKYGPSGLGGTDGGNRGKD